MERRNIRNLIENGLLRTGQELFMVHASSGKRSKVTINSSGFLVDGSGKVFRTPTSAAKSFNSNKPVNGWRAWRDIETNSTLDEIWSTWISKKNSF